MRNLGTHFDPRRREFLKNGAVVLASLFLTGPAAAFTPDSGEPEPQGTGPSGRIVEGPPTAVRPRSLSFYNTHTGERFESVYWSEGYYLPGSLQEINHILRDFRTGEVREIDHSLLDLLHTLKTTTGTGEPFHIISGYRSAATNAMLRSHSDGVAAHSLHLQGKAIDIRLPRIGLRELRDLAARLGRGGVGYYPASDFVHVDVGRPRIW